MNWKLSGRIAFGYAVVLVLVAVAASAGWYGLRAGVQAYERALATLERDAMGALRAEAAFFDSLAAYYRFLLVGSEANFQEWQQQDARARQAMTELRDRSAAGERAAWGEALALQAAWTEKASASIAAKRAGDDAGAIRLFTEQVRPTGVQLSSAVSGLVQAETERARAMARAASAAASTTIWIILGVSVLALLAGAVLAWTLTRTVTAPLSQAVRTLTAAAADVLAATAQQASATAEQGSAVQETVSTVDEVRQTVQLSTQKARAVADSAQRSAQISQDGQKTVEESIRAMREARTHMEGIAQRILTLSEQSQAIAEIMASVNDLAEQSNLLSVNAAIEAAKAGEVGRGFAVVAGEVKSLAEQSKQATARVRTILQDIQRATQAAVLAAAAGQPSRCRGG